MATKSDIQVANETYARMKGIVVRQTAEDRLTHRINELEAQLAEIGTELLLTTHLLTSLHSKIDTLRQT